VNLHFLRIVIPHDTKEEKIELLGLAEDVAVVSLPLEVAKALVGALQTIVEAETKLEVVKKGAPADVHK
jgi:hypothetical protein